MDSSLSFVQAVDITALIKIPDKAHLDKVLRLGRFRLGILLGQGF
jgi:hypothetical protein